MTCGHRPLFNAQVCVDGGIAGCASQVLVFSVRDVLSCSVVSVLLRQTKVNKEQLTERERTHACYLSVTLQCDNNPQRKSQNTMHKITWHLKKKKGKKERKWAEPCCKSWMSKILSYWFRRSTCTCTRGWRRGVRLTTIASLNICYLS